MLLVIDNYDSFTFNLVQAFASLGEEVLTKRNDAVTSKELEALKPDRIVISPGPGNPDESGASLLAVDYAAGKLPLLGVCLGHQAIGQFFGARIVRAPVLMHGKTSPIYHDGQGVFSGIKNPVVQARYHSLVIDPSSLPKHLYQSAWTHDLSGEDKVIMGVRHSLYTIEGIQCHPESIASDQGYDLLRNFLKINGGIWE